MMYEQRRRYCVFFCLKCAWACVLVYEYHYLHRLMSREGKSECMYALGRGFGCVFFCVRHNLHRDWYICAFIAMAHAAGLCNTLQHTATHCNTLQHSATHCNTLQHTATQWPAQSDVSVPTAHLFESLGSSHSLSLAFWQESGFGHVVTPDSKTSVHWSIHVKWRRQTSRQNLERSKSNTLRKIAVHRNTLHHTATQWRYRYVSSSGRCMWSDQDTDQEKFSKH